MKAIIHSCPKDSKNAIRAFQNKRVDVALNKINGKTIEELKALSLLVNKKDSTGIN